MWKKSDNKLKKKYIFKNFVEVTAFFSKVAIVSEKLNHHPKIIIEYNSVEIELFTHDKNNSVTEKDYNLAEAIDNLI